MKNNGLLLLLIILLTVLAGCKETLVEDQLTEGRWVPTAGYKDQLISGEAICPPFDKGVEFKDEESVYVASTDKLFGYELRESDDGMEIEFYNPNGEIDFFKIFMENENGLGLIGAGIIKSVNCYFEREPIK